MSQVEAEFHTFECAARLVGSEELALRLGVTRSQVDVWISGRVAAPAKFVLRAIDVLTTATLTRLSQKHCLVGSVAVDVQQDHAVESAART